MGNKKKKKIFILKAQLTSAIFLLVVALISGFFIFGPKLTEVARALNPSYHRSSGEQLDSGVWNNVVDDALDKNGDTMIGPLTLPADPTANMQAATKQYVDGRIKDTSGNDLRMVCERTYLDAGHWSTGDGNMVIYNDYDPIDKQFAAIRIDTSAAGFTSPPSYFASLGGDYNFGVYGVNDVRSYTQFFEVRLFLNGINRDGKDIFGNYININTIEDVWGWYIDWCGVGN